MTRFTAALTMFMIGLTGFACSQTTITTHKVTDNIYMLEGRGGNIGVSTGEDGVLIIDDQYANMSDAIKDALKKLGDGKLEYVLNTHHHGDHTGGNVTFGAEATIVAHENVYKRLATDRTLKDARLRKGLPTFTFADSLSMHFNGEEIKMIHFPTGHTDTDSVIFFTDSKVVHMGDHFFSGYFPFIDLSAGGDVESYMNNVRTVLSMLKGDEKIIPGHGPLSTPEDLKNFLGMLEDTTGIIRKGIDAGKSLDDLVEAGLPQKYDKAGAGFVNTKRWISIIYTSLSR